MGRCVRRVPLDFGQLLNRVWPGFQNPMHNYLVRCHDCFAGDGMSTVSRLIYESREVQSLPYEKRWVEVMAQVPKEDLYCATCKGAGKYFSRVPLAALSSIGQVPEDKVVDGAYVTDVATIEAIFDLWEPTPPPEGEGWQLWETTSEGSPVTPVFATKEELVTHCVGEPLLPARQYGTREEWEDMFSEEHFYSSTTLSDGRSLINL